MKAEQFVDGWCNRFNLMLMKYYDDLDDWCDKALQKQLI